VPAPTLIEITNAVAADLEGLALPEHSLHKHAEPRAYRVDIKPALGIWPAKIKAELITTASNYYDEYVLKVLWAANIFRSTETNDADEALVSANLPHIDLILSRLRTYGEGVPGLVNTTAWVDTVDFDPAEKGMAWETIITLAVDVFA
jgi:hypothetical protein